MSKRGSDDTGGFRGAVTPVSVLSLKRGSNGGCRGAVAR